MRMCQWEQLYFVKGLYNDALEALKTALSQGLNIAKDSLLSWQCL